MSFLTWEWRAATGSEGTRKLLLGRKFSLAVSQSLKTRLRPTDRLPRGVGRDLCSTQLSLEVTYVLPPCIWEGWGLAHLRLFGNTTEPAGCQQPGLIRLCIFSTLNKLLRSMFRFSRSGICVFKPNFGSGTYAL